MTQPEPDIRSSKSAQSGRSIKIKIPTPAPLRGDESPVSYKSFKSAGVSPIRGASAASIKRSESVTVKVGIDGVLDEDPPISIRSAPRTFGVSAAIRKTPQRSKPPSRSPMSRYALKIERAWISYRNRQMFKLLKHSVCVAENSLSREILRKVCPKEAAFFNDKSVSLKVRLRFGGLEFPPKIFFKVYLSNKLNVKYVSGKRAIKAGSEAARDACDLMGRRNFYDLIIKDLLHERSHGVSDEVDVTTLKDYMQYTSLLDEMPASMGGKENCWRQLTLENLSRQTLFYDVVDFLYNNRLTQKLIDNLPILLSLPNNEDVQKLHVEVLSQYRPPINKFRPVNMTAVTSTSRRSRQALERASKMRELYTAGEETLINDDNEEEEWEKEAKELFEWTKELSFHDDLIETPRPINTSHYNVRTMQEHSYTF
ncbi:DgyrCDS5488 [Dimorphilus gyrociliatus]|uniref:DgyrCDS5488 n=1 Tax=Dimorphilus gyrociliatus TaxID=2664684 RepID=A0A7I8VLN8_9ANNE|nr:DgyrCDS5488 [Dimorphilus gyrociliatus]